MNKILFSYKPKSTILKTIKYSLVMLMVFLMVIIAVYYLNPENLNLSFSGSVTAILLLSLIEQFKRHNIQQVSANNEEQILIVTSINGLGKKFSNQIAFKHLSSKLKKRNKKLALFISPALLQIYDNDRKVFQMESGRDVMSFEEIILLSEKLKTLQINNQKDL